MNTGAAHALWLRVTSVASLVLIAGFTVNANVAKSALLAVSFFAYLVLVLILTDKPRTADLISILRVVLCILAAALPEAPFSVQSSPVSIYSLQLGLFLLAITTDFLDGFVARRQGSTRHGEILDMEADQILVLTLALATARNGTEGIAVLALPALKYAAVVLESALRLEAGTAKPIEGDNRRARVIYAVVLAALVTGLPVFEPGSMHDGLLILALPLLAFSFGADFWHKCRTASNVNSD